MAKDHAALEMTWPVESLVPHSGPMVLLDRFARAGEGWAEAELRVAEDRLFCEPGRGVPAWVGIEYMAQGIAMFAGLAARRAGREIEKGLLVGTRRYEAMRDHFPVGALLTVRVEEEIIDGPAGVFSCTIRDQTGDILAQGRLNVYVPEDQKTFFEEQMA